MEKKYLKSLLYVFLCFSGTISFAQKRHLEITESADNWASVCNPVISNNGKYYAYTIKNLPQGSSTLFIKEINNKWQYTLVGTSNVSISDDSRQALFMKSDSLCLLTLGTESEEWIPSVSYFQLFKQNKSEWLAIQKNNVQRELLLRNLPSGKEKGYQDVSQFVLSPAGNAVLLIKKAKDDSGTETSLYWLGLPEQKLTHVFQSKDELGQFVFDSKGSQLAFMSSKTTGTYNDVSFSKGMPDDIINSQLSAKPFKLNSILRYQPGMSVADVWVNDQTPGIDYGLKVGDGGIYFSKDGNRIFFKLTKIPANLKMPEQPVLVEVWNYKDAYLYSEQQMPSYFGRQKSGLDNDYVAVINKRSSNIIKLQQERDHLGYSTGDDHIILDSYKDASYNPGNNFFRGNPVPYIVSAIDGSRKELPALSYLLSASPSGKYQVYFDAEKKHFFSCQINTGITKNITENIPFSVGHSENEGSARSVPWINKLTWLKKDAYVLVHDQYDLWQVDPAGLKKPVCITNGFGRNNGISLRYLMAFGELSITDVLESNSDILLAGFNEVNYDRGYFKKKINVVSDPEKLLMGPHNLSGNCSGIFAQNTFGVGDILKAKNADVFLFARESETMAPSMLVTRDFKEIREVATIQPHLHVNWYTTELLSWKKFDGGISRGILYKPEDFDSTKKYPVIIWYYETNSKGLHAFLLPATSAGDLNIPNFVSNGYLVFVPDISYKIGAPGESAYNSVVSGAQYLAQRSYVDSKKIGITGHSFGGYQTNYLVTRTSVFAAALAANGPTDLISGYGSLWGVGNDNIYFTENKQLRMGASLWESTQAYINSSPIFKANNVTTPLLLMHAKLDGAVPWHHAVEFFTSLRRLNKKVWLLQYDNEKHVLQNPNNKRDYTIRMAQFFDHYLKDSAEPIWMSRGITAKMKGIDDGLRLETISSPTSASIDEKQK